MKPPELPSGRAAKPLLMAHGWPGSFYEFYGIIPLLTDPKNHGLSDEHVFEVICPSIPGYGFSEASSKKGMGAAGGCVIYPLPCWGQLFPPGSGWRWGRRRGVWDSCFQGLRGLGKGPETEGKRSQERRAFVLCNVPSGSEGRGGRAAGPSDGHGCSMLAQEPGFLCHHSGPGPHLGPGLVQGSKADQPHTPCGPPEAHPGRPQPPITHPHSPAVHSLHRGGHQAPRLADSGFLPSSSELFLPDLEHGQVQDFAGHQEGPGSDLSTTLFSFPLTTRLGYGGHRQDLL